MNSAKIIATDYLDDEDLIVCVKDENTKVLEQNKACIALCGDQNGNECHVGCMEIYEKDDDQQWASWGSRTYRNRWFHDGYFDVTIISTSKQIITILQSLHQKYKQAFEYYETFDLGKRELQVIKLIIAGMSNQEAAEKLSISTSTLRSHLKNIYNKVKEAGGAVDYLPKGRK